MAASVLAAGLIDRGRRVESVALSEAGTSLELPALGRSELSVSTLRRLRGRMTDNRVVVGFGSSTLPACAAAGLGRRSRFVYRSIGDPLFWCNSPGRRFRTSVSLGRAQLVVALWNGAAIALQEVLGVRADRIATIPNGVDDARFSPFTAERRREVRGRFELRPDAPTIVCLGALNPEKRVDLAIDAVARVGGAQLLVAGDGPLRQELEAAAVSKLNGRCRFVGVVAAEQALAAADVLLLPSSTEGMPAAVIEAAFSGIPSVVSDVGALSEMVRDGLTGRLLPTGADAPAFAAALGSVLEVAPSFGAAARDHCMGRFDLATVTRAWGLLLDELAAT